MYSVINKNGQEYSLKTVLFDIVTSALLGLGIIIFLSPLFLYLFIHGDNDRYVWIINGPYPFSQFGGGPFQLWMGAGLLLGGTVLIGFSLLVRYYAKRYILKRSLLISFIFFLLIIALPLLIIFSSEVRNKRAQTDIAHRKILDAIAKEYLQTNVFKANFGGKVFCTYAVLGTEEKDSVVKAYLDALCIEYSAQNGKLKEGSGESFPIALTITKEGNRYRVIEHNDKAGIMNENIDKIFPPNIVRAMRASSERRYVGNIKEEAKLYFGAQ